MTKSRHLTVAERQAIAQIVEDAGFAEVLRLIGGLIRNAVPNTLASWQDGTNEWAESVHHSLAKLAHECNHKLGQMPD